MSAWLGVDSPLFSPFGASVASSDCDRKWDVGRPIDGKHKTMELYNYIQSKF